MLAESKARPRRRPSNESGFSLVVPLTNQLRGQTEGAETEGGEETLGGCLLVLPTNGPLGFTRRAVPFQ